jgi:hypothetical protein
MPSPTSLSLQALRRSGFTADVVERFLPRISRRRDLFGCIDIIAVDRREPGILGIQATSLPHVAERLAKARSKPELTAWLKAGGRFEVWGWYKRAGAWRVKVLAVRLEDLRAITLQAPARRGRRSRQPELFD